MSNDTTRDHAVAAGTGSHNGEGPRTSEGPSAVGDGPSTRFTNPGGFEISLPVGRGVDIAGADRGERRQPMRGFEDTYVDIVDYIVRITHRIWEDQDVGYIYDTYAPGCRVFTDAGMQYGVEAIVESTLLSLHAFPDARHYADDVIWAGDEDTGFATSHRAVNVGHHLGAWRWGPATNRKFQTWVIANCVTRENEIFEEWVLYNTGATLAQLGIDVVAAAREYGNERAYLEHGDLAAQVDRLIGGRRPTPYPDHDGDGFDVDHTVRSLFHDTYNRRDLSAIDRAYDPNVRWNGPTNRQGVGRGTVRAMARSLLATFPDLGLLVDEVYWQGNPDEGFAVSVRWSAAGTHRGPALYGPPTGRRVSLWGINQLYVRDGRIVEDWCLFNEFDVMAQVHADEPRL